jgi:hypothetical protein
MRIATGKLSKILQKPVNCLLLPLNMLIGSDPTIKDYLTSVGLKWFVSKHMANSNSSEFQKESNCSLPISKGYLMITSNPLIISAHNQLLDRCQMTDCPWLSASTPTCSHDSHHQSSHWMPSLSSVRVLHGGRQPHKTCPPSFETARSETILLGPIQPEHQSHGPLQQLQVPKRHEVTQLLICLGSSGL